MKKTLAFTAVKNPGPIFSEAASLPLGVSAAARGATPAKSGFVTPAAVRRLDMRLPGRILRSRAIRTKQSFFRVHVP